MSMERIVDALLGLGILESDAKVYIYLALNGPLKAKEVVGGLGSHKKQVYESLRKLIKIGLVFCSCDVPRVFYALLFEKVLDLLAEKKKHEAELLKHGREDLLCSWKNLVDDDIGCLSFNCGFSENDEDKDQKIDC